MKGVCCRLFEKKNSTMILWRLIAADDLFERMLGFSSIDVKISVMMVSGISPLYKQSKLARRIIEVMKPSGKLRSNLRISKFF